MKMLREFLFLAFLLLSCSVKAGVHAVALQKMDGISADCYIYRDTCRSIEGRFAGFAPMFLVYPDMRVNADEACQLVAEMGLDSLTHTFAGSVAVVNPVGESYSADKDLKAYEELLNHLRVISNLKVIGIGRGATFVNQTLAAHAEAIAGIVSIGGKAANVKQAAAVVPAFIAGDKADKAARSYIATDKAALKSRTDRLDVYESEFDSLIRVVVSHKDYASVKAAIGDAWQCLLSRNYRFNNMGHTWYTGCTAGEYGAYELEPYIMPEQLGIERRVKTEDICGMGTFLWYEYLPKTALSAAEKSVPLVILLHGNNNDPRTQAETSGFVSLSAQKHFIVAELEWQGNGFAPMGLDGIEQVVYHLLETYPQIDPERVYAEGLSAGAATATGLGIRKSHVFAAVGAQSAGLTPNRYMFGYNQEALMNEARQKRGSVEMPYFSITGTKDEVVPFMNKDNWATNAFFCAWQAYQTMNGMDVMERPDFSVDSIFGMTLAQRDRLQTNKDISVEFGIVPKGDIPMIWLLAVRDYGHWNFVPGADMMWEFFSHFSRDINTKKLKYKP